MLRIILLLCVAVLGSSITVPLTVSGSSITVPLKIANETVYFYPNGTLDAAKVKHHIHYVQCLRQHARIEHSLACFDASFWKRGFESIKLFSAYHAATPVGELRIGGQAINVIFDTND
ncbi:hypothetical protein V8E36_001289 [Tilletia maclaganii]